MSEYVIKVPPDSTGKGIRHQVLLEVEYTNLTGTLPVGSLVTFGTSTVEGTILRVHSGTFHTTPHMHLILTHGSPEAVSVGEDVFIDAVKQAEVSGQTESFYHPISIPVGGNNPLHSQFIDEVGAAKVRFNEGSPQFDAFGAQQVSSKTKLGDYVMSYNELPEDFTDVIVGGGSLTYVGDTRGVTLSCGTASGDSVTRTTNRYHRYQPGVSQLIEMTSAVGDSGKTNVTRCWGYSDEDNGLFFSLVDTTLNVVLRSKVTGSVVDTLTPQSLWNGDRMDGAGGSFNISGLTLDASKNNLYWIDFQWLGAGTVRFGVFIEGKRVVCHSIKNANANNTAYMSTGSLPLRYEQINTGVAASGSEFKFYCATVITEGEYTPTKVKHNDTFSATTSGTTRVPVVSFRPAQTFEGKDNRTTIEFASFSAFNGSDTAVIIEATFNGTVTGGAYVTHSASSSVEHKSGGSAISADHNVRSFILAPGQTETWTEEDKKPIFRNADITQTPELNFVISQVVAGTAGLVTLTANWDEIQD